MCNERTPWEQAVDFHGHSCMGLAIGFRAAEAAMRNLNNQRDVDEEIVAIVENDSCAVDAIQVVTGCTFGKGNLIYRDFGKQAYTFALRGKGKDKAIRVIPKSFEHEDAVKQLRSLRERVSRGEAGEEEQTELKEKTEEFISEYLSRSLEEVCQIKEVEIEVPSKARLFSTLKCASCGEMVMEPRARLKEGEVNCIPCAEGM